MAGHLKESLVQGRTPGAALTLLSLRVNLVDTWSYWAAGRGRGGPTLALCMVNRSTPVPVTLMLETSDRKLKEMVT